MFALVLTNCGVGNEETLLIRASISRDVDGGSGFTPGVAG